MWFFHAGAGGPAVDDVMQYALSFESYGTSPNHLKWLRGLLLLRRGEVKRGRRSVLSSMASLSGRSQGAVLYVG